MVPLGRVGQRQLVGQAANLTFECACMLDVINVFDAFFVIFPRFYLRSLK